jgi:hypothetical protein
MTAERSSEIPVLPSDWEDKHTAYSNPDIALSMSAAVPEKHLPIDIHYYWRQLRPFARKQRAAIASALVACPEATVHVWSDQPLTGEYWDSLYNKRLFQHIYKPEEIAKECGLEKAKIYGDRDSLCFCDGDVFRTLILYAHGGYYVDTDSLLLRDLSSLDSIGDFVYQWGSEADQMSSAVQHYKKGSKVARTLLRIMSTMPYTAETTDLGKGALYALRSLRRDFTVLPCSFMHPEWQRGWSMALTCEADPFAHRSDMADEDFLGSFCWHWHNKWWFPDDQISDDSKFARLESCILQKLSLL